MDFILIIGIAVGLAMDAFAVAIASTIAIGNPSPRQIFRFTFHFGLFQAFMPVIGWYISQTFIHLVEAWDHWIALGLLLFIGIRAIHSAICGGDDDCEVPDPTKGSSLVMLSVATSIDALAAGIGLAALNLEIWVSALIIGVITASLTFAGMRIGGKLGQKFGKRMEILGGVILILIGVKIIVSHMSGN